jgi:hypothetical protein
MKLPGDRRSGLLFPLLLLLATLAVYGTTLDHGFIYNWDDTGYLLENEAIRGFTLENIKLLFGNYFIGNYAPIHLLSYLIEYTLWGLNPAGYHVVNLLLHGANGILLYFLLRRLSLEDMTALLAAAIFICHPVQVESVAWISERKNLLAMLFFLLALSHYLSWRESGSYRDYALTLAAFILAVLSKSVVVIFPVVVLMVDLCFPVSGRRLRLADKVPFILIAAAGSALAIMSQSHFAGGGVREYPGGNLLTTMYTMLPVLVTYLQDCLWPVGLLPLYLVPIRVTPDPVVICSLLLFLGVIAWGCRLWRRERRLCFFLALFFVALLPVSQLVPLITLKNDRYLYFPLLGFSPLAAVLAQKGLLLLPWRDAFRTWGTIILFLPLPLLAMIQAGRWQDDLTLWEYTVAREPEHQVAWMILAKGYTLRNNGQAAVAALTRFHHLKEKNGPVRGWENH